MIIDSLIVENWKSFKSKTKFEFSIGQLISRPNGYGKTSIFQAIMFAMYGVVPAGFNMNTVRNDPESPAYIDIMFHYEDASGTKICNIHREINGSQKNMRLAVNGEVIEESSSGILNYINAISPRDIVQTMWSSDISMSDILKVSFFKDNIVNEILKEPIQLLQYYNAKLREVNRDIKANFIEETFRDPAAIKLDIENIQTKLKDIISDRDLSLANAAKDAKEKMDNLASDNDNIKNYDEYTAIEDSREYNNFDRYKNELAKELSKGVNRFSSFNKNEIKKILDSSLSLNKCSICGSDFDEGMYNSIMSDLLVETKDVNKINNLKQRIDHIKLIDIELVNKAIEYHKLSKIYNSCKNYNEIIESYDKSNNELWNKFNSLKEEYNKSIRLQEIINKVKELEKIKDKYTKIKEFLSKYISEASEYYMSSYLDKASEYISSINPKYQGIVISEDSLNVIMENEDRALILNPVVKMSTGEKTIISLSLILSIHDIVVPESPLLFDESFACLDYQNLEEVKRIVRNKVEEGTQIFIITHDTTWEQF